MIKDQTFTEYLCDVMEGLLRLIEKRTDLDPDFVTHFKAALDALKKTHPS